ncbi:MAG TPA: aminoglycoside phosphotransferase family protein [Gaiellaceae bacterium]|nr:aminoglycoside phosphotransferase family protein [Gaiellaceae bacterium]
MADAGLTHAEWLSRVPTLLAETSTAWGLTLGEAYAPGAAGYAVRAELPGGHPAVLKLIDPHREAEREAAALARWAGDGAVRLLAHDPERWALLLERCEPGTMLAERPAEEALDILVGLLPRLWKNADGFNTLEREAERWTDEIARDARDPELRDAALAYLRELPRTQGAQVLVNQDLHGENVLAAQREPWLVIDPKPLSGEREFAVAPIVRSFELGHSKRDMLYRFDRLTAELGLDRERARGWTVAQTVAWSGGSDYWDVHLDTVRWLLEEA